MTQNNIIKIDNDLEMEHLIESEILCKDFCRCEGITYYFSPQSGPVFCEGSWCNESYDKYLEELNYYNNRKDVITCQKK